LGEEGVEMERITEIENMVDALGLPKASVKQRRHHRTLKVLGVIAIVAMLTSVGVATYLTYFAKFDKQLTVTQSVTVDGHNWDKPFTYAGTISAGCCEIDGPHTVTNNGCEGIWLDFITTETSNPSQSLDGLTVSVKQCVEEPKPCYLTGVEITALDGQALWDSYDVYVNDVLVGHYTAVDDGGIENWVTSFFDLKTFNIECSEHNVVKIDCVDGPWTYFNPWGQLGVDNIKLWCDEGCTSCPPVLCDEVNIGDVTSEGTHVMTGWGPIEPVTHGGTWGGIANCRATWFYEQVVGQPMKDESWASIEMVCDCNEPTLVTGHCECSDPDMKLPFYLEPGKSLDFCIAYKASMLLQPNVYNIQTLLIPAAQA
jgi:hypothetical protein